jgi:hypothetical protein
MHFTQTPRLLEIRGELAPQIEHVPISINKDAICAILRYLKLKKKSAQRLSLLRLSVIEFFNSVQGWFDGQA